MDNKVKRNYLFNLAFQILNIIAPLITMPYVSRILSASGVGEYSYAYSIVSYFLIFASLGTSLYGCREIARSANQKHEKSIVFFEIFSIRITSSIIVILAYISFVFAAGFSGIEKNLLLINTLYLLATALDISWLFQGEETFSTITVYSFITKVITVIAVFVLVKSENDVVIYVLIHAGLALVNSVLYYFRLNSRIERVNFKELKATRHLMPVFILLIPQVSKEIYCVLDKTMIGALYNDRALNGYYEQAVNIVSMSMTVVTSMNIVKMSNLSHDQATDTGKKLIFEKMESSFHFIWFVGLPVCCGIVSVIDLFVPFFFGTGYDPVITIVYLLVPEIMIIGVSNAIGIQYLITLKRHKEFNTSIILGLFSNAILNWILIPKFNVYGAAVATVISEMVVTITQLIFVHKDFKLSTIFPKETFKRCIASASMFIILFFLKKILAQFGIFYFVQIGIIVVTGVIIYVVCEILLRDSMMSSICKLIKEKIAGRR